MENKLYCAYCGKEITSALEKCPSCQKKLPAKDRFFLQFLLDHTKDKIKGDIEDSIFEAIKNYLLSHLFGVVLTLTVIVVAAASVIFSAAPAPQYKHITPVESIEEVRPEEDYLQALSKEDKAQIEANLQSFATALDIARFQAGNDAFLYAISDELYFTLENTPTEELYYDYSDESLFPYVRSQDDPRNYITVKEDTYSTKVQSAVAMELEGLGYEVCSVEVTHSLYAAAVDSSAPVAQEDYLVTLAKENGNWLLAESIRK